MRCVPHGWFVGRDLTRSWRRARLGGRSVYLRDVKIDLCRGKIGEEDKRKRDKKRLCLGKA